MATPKLQVGISMLADAREGDFSSVHETLKKILGNIVANPAEPKFRKLRTTNAKIGALLATTGVRAVIIGSGFAEQGEFLVLPDEASAEGCEAALAALQAQADDRVAAEAARKAAEFAARKENQGKENDERKRMKAQIGDDAAARKEPGWKAKAAGVKEGKAITGCSDVGIGNSGGG